MRRTLFLVAFAILAIMSFVTIRGKINYQNSPDVVAAKRAGYEIEPYVRVCELQRKYQGNPSPQLGDLTELKGLSRDPNPFIQTRAVSTIRNYAKLASKKECLKLLEQVFLTTKEDLPRSNALKSIARLDQALALSLLKRGPVTGELTQSAANELQGKQ